MDPSPTTATSPSRRCCAGARRWRAIARTGLGFTESLYEQERFEEILKVAADIRAEADGEDDDPDHAGGLVQEWMDTVGKGVPGYVTPKVAVGAAVGNDKGELLLIQRADSGIWLYPTGWCDVGYSAAEVVVKEVEEETGIIVEPVRLIAVLDGLRLGFTRVPLYSLLFYCRAVGGELAPHPLETRDVGWFTRETLPQPARRVRALGRARLRRHQRRAPRRPLRQRAPTDVAGRRSATVVIAVEAAASVDDDLVRGGRPPSSPSSPRSSPPPHAATSWSGSWPTRPPPCFVARDDGRIVGMLTLATFQIPTGVRGLDRGRRGRRGGPGSGRRRPRSCRPRSSWPQSSGRGPST